MGKSSMLIHIDSRRPAGYITLAEFAKQWGISRSAAEDFVYNRAKIPTKRVGWCVYVSEHTQYWGRAKA